MRHIYSLITYLLLPFVLLKLCWAGLRNPEYRYRWPERFGLITPIHGKPVIWIHAVSVGEVQAAVPLINRLLKGYPEYSLVVTTTTPTGAHTVKQRFGQTVIHYYLPYDMAWAVKRFLTRLEPSMLIIMETEIWPNLLHYTDQAGVPVLLVNARMSARSAAGYSRFPRFIRQTLAHISLIAAQSHEDARRLIELGAAKERTLVTGNLKFDIKLPASIREQAEVMRRSLTAVNRPVWIAASTHEGEEKLVLDAFAQVLRQSPDCLLLLAPRHPERCERVAELCRRRGYTMVRRSEGAAVMTDMSVYLIDTMGELSVCYAAADIAFIGGSLVPIGGHNMLEAASLGLPILTGPHFFNFAEVTDMLCRAGAAWVVDEQAALASHVVMLLEDANLRYKAGQSGCEIVQSHAGGADELMFLLHDQLQAAAAAWE
mgnify:CR=1 FL=1